jgi:hypothetical protein
MLKGELPNGLVYLLVKGCKSIAFKNIILYFCTMTVRRTLILLLFTCFIVGLTDAQGCSQCRLLSEQSAELDENSFGSSINFGILYLMAIPYLLLMFLFRKRIARFFRQLSSR